MEDIISEYVDAVNAGQILPVEEFLARYMGRDSEEMAELRATLNSFLDLRQQVQGQQQLSLAEKQERGWRRVRARMRAESAVPTPPEVLRAPSVGTLLGQALEAEQSAVREFDLPSAVLLALVEDTSPIDLVVETPDTRMQFAQRYATDNPQLLRTITQMLNRLRALWRSQGQPAAGLIYTRPAPPEGQGEEPRRAR
jgi:hypothetical protein